jgi:hypothetical protein
MRKVWALISSNKIIDFVDLKESADGIDRIERYSNIFNLDFFVKEITHNKKIKLNSVWDGNSFSESEDERPALDAANYYFAIVQDNKVVGISKVFTKPKYDLYKQAEINGISAVEVTDMNFSTLKVGMSWDGSNFA